jgi:protein arginine kinase activator
MICNLCGKHQATIYFKGIVNNQAIKLHLCESCAKKKGMVFPFGKSIFSLGDVVANLANASKAGITLFGTTCKVCDLTYAEFKETSQLGCSQCYSTFSSLIGPLLKQIHGSTQHVGKPYRRTVRLGSHMEELARLKLELREAVQHEKFEKAAELRDQIHQLEQTMTQPKPKETASPSVRPPEG